MASGKVHCCRQGHGLGFDAGPENNIIAVPLHMLTAVVTKNGGGGERQCYSNVRC
jgi:hypothetical protein